MIKKPGRIILVLFIMLAACHNKSGNQQQAGLNPQQAQNLKSADSSKLNEDLIQAYSDSGYYDKALAATEKFIQKDSLDARFWYIRGTLFAENEDTMHAIESFEKAISITPDAEYIKLLGGLYAQTKNPRALTVADSLQKNAGQENQTAAFFIKGFYYSYAGDKNKAIAFFNKCLSLDYTYSLAYREKAICLYELKKYNDALAVLTKAIEVQSTYDEAYYWMGMCNEKLGNKEEAIRDYKTALQIDNNKYDDAQAALNRLQ